MKNLLTLNSAFTLILLTITMYCCDIKKKESFSKIRLKKHSAWVHNFNYS